MLPVIFRFHVEHWNGKYSSQLMQFEMASFYFYNTMKKVLSIVPSRLFQLKYAFIELRAESYIMASYLGVVAKMA